MEAIAEALLVNSSLNRLGALELLQLPTFHFSQHSVPLDLSSNGISYSGTRLADALKVNR